MKIAVTYENGQIFQHFGHTEQFKIYTVELSPTRASFILVMFHVPTSQIFASISSSAKSFLR